MSPNNDNKIKLTFATTAGDLTDEFPLNQPLHAVKTRVMAELKLDPSQADAFCVSLAGMILDDNQKLNELGLEDCTILTLERCEVTKIAG